MKDADVPNELMLQLGNWHYFTWLSGDIIVEQNSQNIDVCNWILDGTPVRARGRGGRKWRLGHLRGDIFDEFIVDYEYPGGVTMTANALHSAEPGVEYRVGETVEGTAGVADVGAASIEDGSGSTKWRYRGPKNNPYPTEMDDFCAAIFNDLPYNEGDYAANSIDRNHGAAGGLRESRDHVGRDARVRCGLRDS